MIAGRFDRIRGRVDVINRTVDVIEHPAEPIGHPTIRIVRAEDVTRRRFGPIEQSNEVRRRTNEVIVPADGVIGRSE